MKVEFLHLSCHSLVIGVRGTKLRGSWPLGGWNSVCLVRKHLVVSSGPTLIQCRTKEGSRKESELWKTKTFADTYFIRWSLLEELIVRNIAMSDR